MSSLQKFHRRTNRGGGNTPHTGIVTITGTASVGSILTANNTLADVDGLGTFAYVWKRTGSPISGATSSTYTLVTADAGNTITVTITYTDGKGNIETETSAATDTVITPSPFAAIGGGNNTVGYWLGTAGDGTSKLIAAPKSTEVQREWGSYGTVRSTTSTTNGVANTTTLFGFGAAAHPAAHYAKSLTTGGYNTWYLPAKNELNTLYVNRSATPFATANAFVGTYYCSSTESTAKTIWIQTMSNGSQYGDRIKNAPSFYVRATRRSTI